MGALEFIASLASSLGWPVAAVVVVVILRRPLTALLQRALRVRLPGGVEAEFAAAEALGQAVAFQESVEAGVTPEPPTGSAAEMSGGVTGAVAVARMVQLTELLRGAPDAESSTGIVMTHEMIEAILREALRATTESNLRLQTRAALAPLPVLIDTAAAEGLLTEVEALWMRTLHRIRNTLVASDVAPSEQDVQGTHGTAVTIAERLIERSSSVT